MIPHSYEVPAAVLLVLGGALSCFAGYRLFKITLGIYGFILGAMLASSTMGVSNTTGMIAAAIIGGIAGAVAGNQVGHGNGRNLATIVGAAGGALGGLAVEGKVRETKHWDTVVRLDDGTTQTLRSDAQPFWRGGERVRLLDGKLSPAS